MLKSPKIATVKAEVASTVLLSVLLMMTQAVGSERPSPAGPSAPAQSAPDQPAPPGRAVMQPAPPKAYQPVKVTLTAAPDDPDLEAFRKELAAAARNKDRAALSRMIVTSGFFWAREDGDGADRKKSGIDNLAEAFGLDTRDSAGWDVLAMMAANGRAAPDPQSPETFCAPAAPIFDDKAFDDLTRATQTDPGEWGYPAADGLEVREAPQSGARVFETLGLILVRVFPDNSPLAAVQGTNEDWLRIVAPSGKLGYVPVGSISALATDQVCYRKDQTGWRVAGLVSADFGQR